MLGSESRGLDCIKVSTDSNSKFINIIEKLSCEKLYLSFCRSILGVQKKSQNSAVRGELGMMPLGLVDIVANIINYQNHLESKHPHSLVGDVWLTNSTVPNDKWKTTSWAQH